VAVDERQTTTTTTTTTTGVMLTTVTNVTTVTTVTTRARASVRARRVVVRGGARDVPTVRAERMTATGDDDAAVAFETNAKACVSALAIAACATVMPEAAHASGGEFGILEGRSAALLHPIGFGAMYAISLYAGWLGLQWRRVRTVGDEITELKKTLPADAEAAAGSAAAKQIDELTATRKELVAGKFKDKHANMGYLLLALGVTLAVEGGMNTYLRVGKLFPGPHLYAGASIVVLWAMAAGLVPQMEKGNQKARDLHIALNCINVALFTWQIPTGLEIVGKVFQFTSWP
jgi:hypothetical protein